MKIMVFYAFIIFRIQSLFCKNNIATTLLDIKFICNNLLMQCNI